MFGMFYQFPEPVPDWYYQYQCFTSSSCRLPLMSPLPLLPVGGTGSTHLSSHCNWITSSSTAYLGAGTLNVQMFYQCQVPDWCYQVLHRNWITSSTLPILFQERSVCVCVGSEQNKTTVKMISFQKMLPAGTYREL